MGICLIPTLMMGGIMLIGAVWILNGVDAVKEEINAAKS